MAKQTARQFTFKFVKAHDFKTVPIDGIFGSVTVKRELNINFFVDVSEMPKTINHEVISHGRIGKEIAVDTTPGVGVREVPFGINVDVGIAKSIVIWLNEKIKEIESINSDLESIDSQEK